MKKKSGQQLTELAEQIERDVREIREKLRRPLVAEVERSRLTGPQIGVMRVVYNSEGMSVKAIAQRTGLAHSTVSGIVDRLAARGLLERQARPDDRRESRVTVTRAVRQYMAKRAPELMTQPLARALARARPSERQVIVRGLETLRRLIGLEPRQHEVHKQSPSS